jgi:hypothetical protein
VGRSPYSPEARSVSLDGNHDRIYEYSKGLNGFVEVGDEYSEAISRYSEAISRYSEVIIGYSEAISKYLEGASRYSEGMNRIYFAIDHAQSLSEFINLADSTARQLTHSRQPLTGLPLRGLGSFPKKSDNGVVI